MFRDITIDWRGKHYVIPANRVFGAIARMEDYIVLQDLVTATEAGRMPFAKASQAFAALLNFAGVQGVSAEDVYDNLFGDPEQVRSMAVALQVIRQIMIPPKHLQEKAAAGEGKAAPTGASSSSATGQRSAASGARRKSSGRSRL
jgi:hypothetical protein